MPKPTTILIDGKPHHPVAVMAKLLRTTLNRVRELMGNGSLDCNQPKVNGPIVVSAASEKRYLDRRNSADR